MGLRLSDYTMADVMLHTSEVWLKPILMHAPKGAQCMCLFGMIDN